MIQLEDVIQYYIGRECYVNDITPGYISSVDEFGGTHIKLHGVPKAMYVQVQDVKPILRRLEDMGEFEATELARLQTDPKRHADVDVLFIEKERIHYMDGSKWTGDGVEEFFDLYIYFNQLSPAQSHYLLKQGFDLFLLIDSGQAIDAKTIQPPQTQQG